MGLNPEQQRAARNVLDLVRPYAPALGLLPLLPGPRR
jgi:hypothetical protein